MKRICLIFVCLLSTSLFFKANAQKKELYPQVHFDSLQAKSMLGLGNSTIEGVAFTRLKNGYGMKIGQKMVAKNTEINLYPVTPYFTEWYNLRKKKEGKKTSVFMSQEAYNWRAVVKTDDYGRFKFVKMKPGKYFLQTMANYSLQGTRDVYVGSDRNDYGGGTDYYKAQNYINDYTDRVEEFVEITRDGQVIEMKLH